LFRETMNIDDKIALILGRRTVRVFQPGDVTEAQVQKLLEAAMAAPSAMTKDPWRFVVVRKRATLEQIAAVCPGGKMLPSCNVAIVVCGALDVAFDQNVGYLLQDCSAAIENLLICAHAQGLGACWVGAYPAESSMAGLTEVLKLPEKILPIAVIAVGLPGENPEPRTRYEASAVHDEQW
jgi:nitroreductase